MEIRPVTGLETVNRLESRAKALQAEASELVELLDLGSAFPTFGPAQVVGSALSGLMVWRDLDVVFSAPEATAAEVFDGLARLATSRPGLLAADFRDERGERRPTPRLTDERFYVVLGYQGSRGEWKVDLTIWLHAVDRPFVAEADRLRAASAEQRLAILQLKDLWYRSPHYPAEIGGTDVYAAVLDHAVRTPAEFAAYLAAHGLPADPDLPHSPTPPHD